MSTTALVERLIQTVGRAFYPDNIVIVLDVLIKEKYIRDDEFGPRLKLSNKEIRKILHQLHEEMLIQYEDVTMLCDNKMMKCWYIDYYLFTLIIRYRIYQIQLKQKIQEKLELNSIFFQCPSCYEKYNELQIQRLISKDYKFLCSHCCPSNDFKNTLSQPYYTLKEINPSSSSSSSSRGRGGGGDSGENNLNNTQKLNKKMTEQWTLNEYHDGIFDLLSELKDQYIIRNLPSENIKRGLVTSKVTDDDVMLKIEENSSTNGRKRKSIAEVYGGVGIGLAGGFTVEVADGDVLDKTEESILSTSCSNTMGEIFVPQRQKAMPSFLMGSRIITTNEVDGGVAGVGGNGTSNGSKMDGEGKNEEVANEVEDDDEWED